MAAAVPWIAAYFATCSFWSDLHQHVRLVLTSWSLFLVLKNGHNFLVSWHDSRRWHMSGKRPRQIWKVRRGCSSVVLRIGLKYRQRLDIKGDLATILPKLIERMRTYVIYSLDLLFFCSSASFYDPIELCPEEGFTKERASIDVHHLNVTSPVVIIVCTLIYRACANIKVQDNIRNIHKHYHSRNFCYIRYFQ